MNELSELELRIAREYARREELNKVADSHRTDVKEAKSVMDTVQERLSSQQRTLELLEYRLSGIQGALNKIVWLMVAPVLTGSGFLIIQAINSLAGH